MQRNSNSCPSVFIFVTKKPTDQHVLLKLGSEEKLLLCSFSGLEGGYSRIWEPLYVYCVHILLKHWPNPNGVSLQWRFSAHLWHQNAKGNKYESVSAVFPSCCDISEKGNLWHSTVSPFTILKNCRAVTISSRRPYCSVCSRWRTFKSIKFSTVS